jgi:superfamily I DNA/RNA helicase
VLLTCYNRPLGDHLAAALSGVAAVDTRTVHSFMAGVVAESGLTSRLPAASEADLFAVFYPELTVEALLDSGPRYDAVVVDEAQDVLRPAYLDVLDAALDGGLANGVWRAFLDPRQNIFAGTDASALADMLKLGPVQFRLSVNCRNSAPIATDTALLSGLECEDVLKADGPEVEHEWYRDRGHQRRLVTNRLNRLLSDGVRPTDVVVLGRRRLDKSSLGAGLADRSGPKLVEYTLHAPKNAVRYATISGFKGLEADVVLLVDVDDLTSPEARQSLYVGVSRCKALLCVFLDEAVRPEYEQLATEFGERAVTRLAGEAQLA